MSRARLRDAPLQRRELVREVNGSIRAPGLVLSIARGSERRRKYSRPAAPGTSTREAPMKT